MLLESHKKQHQSTKGDKYTGKLELLATKIFLKANVKKEI